MKKRIKRWGIIASILFIATMLTNNITAYAEIQVSSSEVLEQERQLINAYYLNDIPQGALEKDNLKDMVDALKEPYSQYFTAKEYEDFTGSVNNRFSGIGISIDVVSEGLKVIKVISDSPALESGIKAGDIVIEANGHMLAGMSSEEAVSYVRGEVGTFVDLKIKRDEQVLSFKVMRKELTLATVNSKIFDDHIGYIVISSFGEHTGAEFKAELDKLIKAKADSYIIDLRYNPGGYISTALDIAGYFIGEEACTVIKDKSGKTQVLNGNKQDIKIDKPVIFLTNEFSASASELLSAAVKDYGKAYFIGENTYGKGVGQAVYNLMDGSFIKLTTIKFTSPKGNEINKIGVSPDLKVKTDDKDPEKSIQLARMLLSSNASNSDKTGTFAIKLNNNMFEVKEALMKAEEFKTASEYLTTTVLNDENTFKWKDNAWIQLSTLKAESDSEKVLQNNQAEEKVAANSTNNDVALAQVASAKLEEAKTVLPHTGSFLDFNVLMLIGAVGIIYGGRSLFKNAK
jgi:carboxyl-terminal processing protease